MAAASSDRLAAGASTPGGQRGGLRIGTWNVGMPDENSFAARRGEAIQTVVDNMLRMLNQHHVHIVGINELHPVHQRAVAEAFLQHKHAAFAGVKCGDAVIWRRWESKTQRFASVPLVSGVRRRFS